MIKGELPGSLRNMNALDVRVPVQHASNSCTTCARHGQKNKLVLMRDSHLKLDLAMERF